MKLKLFITSIIMSLTFTFFVSAGETDLQKSHVIQVVSEANKNPFGMTELTDSFKIAADGKCGKCGEGMCGGSMGKGAEAKCGESMGKAAKMEHDAGGSVQDPRTSLNLPPMMKQHQLANMRNHLDAVRRILLAMSNDDFETASGIASKELGTSEKMMKMCKRMNNEDFTKIGLAFHESGDELAKTLKEADLKQSLKALDNTMNFCVTCHATFRQ